MTKAEGANITDQAFSEKKEVAIKLLRVFEGRVKWRFFFNHIVPADKLPKSRGFNSLVEKINAMSNSLSGNMIIDNVIALKDKLLIHCLSGEKSVKLFELKDQNDAILLRQSLQSNISKFDNLDTLPEQDESDFSSKPQLFSIKQLMAGYYISFLSVRTVKSKEDIPLSAVSEDYKDLVPVGSKLYCVSNQKKICCDTVFVPNNGHVIEFRVDNSEHFNVEERNNAHVNLMTSFVEYYSDEIGYKLNGRHLDFFPLIRQVLDYPVGDGRVIELKFMTAKGAAKQHKGKNSSEGCILIDEYHLGGAEKINGEYDPYMISRVWDLETSDGVSTPQLTLPGNIRMLSSTYQTGLLQEVLITGSIGEDDYRRVIDKLACLI